jgi:hypothetical protein
MVAGHLRFGMINDFSGTEGGDCGWHWLSSSSDAHVLDGIIAIALAVPHGAAGLRVAGLVRGAGTDGHLTWPTGL